MQVKGLLLDVEGVLVADKRYRAVPGAVEFIQYLRGRGLPVRLITNNTTDDEATLVEKLGAAGFDFRPPEVHTCIQAAVTRLREIGAVKCLVVGTERLKRAFAAEGFSVADASDVHAVVVGLDTALTHQRLCLACDAILRFDARLIALHRNRLYPDADGRALPSVGAVVEAISYATQAVPEVMGKPNAAIYRQALEALYLAPEEALMVSDDPFSDLAGARRLGIRAAFVLSGKYTDPAILDRLDPAERPDLVVDSIGDLAGTDWLPLQP